MKKKEQKKSRQIKKKIIFFAAILLLVWWYNNFTLSVSQTTVISGKIRDEIKIVQLSDLHGASFGKGNKTLINKVRAQDPDLVVVTGDVYTTGKKQTVQTAFDLLSALAKEFTVYYVNGEHDYPYRDHDFFDSLEKAGVSVMNYKDEIITVKNTKLHIYGINNAQYSSTFNLANAFNKDGKNFTILLAHIPNFKKFADFGTDLSLCGDTHGGMFRLPYVGAVYDGEKFFPETKGDYVKGMYELNGSFMFISSGLGRYPAPVRFCNRPEISVINLKPE